jgi:hypothetical protein
MKGKNFYLFVVSTTSIWMIMVILRSMGGVKYYCEKVFKSFVAWNLKLRGLEIGSLI